MTATNKPYHFSKDSFNDDANIGDIIAYASGGTLCLAQILGFTPNGIYISTCHIKNRTYNMINTPVEQHNSKRYLRYISFKVIEKQKPISDELKPFCYFHQMKQDGTV